MRFARTIHVILCFLIIPFSKAQDIPVYKGDPDLSFAHARNLASNNQRKQAQDTLQFIVTKFKDYHEVRCFLGTTYSWDGNFTKAKIEFDYILERDPKNKPAWIGLIQNALWSNSYNSVLELADKALGIIPNDEDILLLKAKAQINTDKQIEALHTINTILAKNPANIVAREIKKDLKKDLFVNKIGIIASAEFYSEATNPQQNHSLRYSRQTEYGVVTAIMNFTQKLNTNGIQYEIDMYPKINKVMYGNLNVAYSNSPLFPQIKYGAELFKSLPKGFEVSAGIRALHYSTSTMIYTGSIGWYSGNNYWMLRPYLTPGDAGNSISGTFNYRKYLKDKDNYFTGTLGLGYSPEVNQLNYGSLEQQKFNLKSQKINIGYTFTTPNNQHALGTKFGITHQEELFKPGNYSWIYFLSLSWDIMFRKL